MNFEQFNRDFFLNNHTIKWYRSGNIKTNAGPLAAESITWYNTKGLLDLRNGNIAEITIKTNGVHGEYVGYNVTITNKINGEITSHWFGFDNEMLYPNIKKDCADGYKIIENCCQDGIAKWYIKTPDHKAIDKMAEKIIQFCEQYK